MSSERSVSAGESEDGDMDNIKKQLEDCITEEQKVGQFAVTESYKFSNSINPDLTIQNPKGTSRPVGLPLSDSDAETLIAACHQAPFGKGTETVVDLSVRKTWELNSDLFELRNQAWHLEVDKIVEKVRKGMGIETDIRAELYKLLLYEQGAMFKAHKDSEKAPGMFGTLVISLPSKHCGGAVELSHSGEKLVLKTDVDSDNNLTYMAWFSDVLHEVQPVVSGRRLVLTYNLVNVSNPAMKGSALRPENDRLRHLLSSWLKSCDLQDGENPQVLAYKLEHQYTESNMDYEALKGYDQQVVSQLKSTCPQLGWEVYLGNTEREVLGTCDDEHDGYGYSGYGYGYGRYGYGRYRRGYEEGEDEGEESDNEDDEHGYGDGGSEHHSIDEVIEDTMLLVRIVNLDGIKVATNIEIDKGCFIQKDVFDREPDDEEFSGYTGNEGVSTTHFYRDSVVLLVPNGASNSFFLDRGHDLSTEEHEEVNEFAKRQLHCWLTDLNSDPQATDIRKSLSSICNLVIAKVGTEQRPHSAMYAYHSAYYENGSGHQKSATFSQEVVDLVFTAFLKLHDIDSFSKALPVALVEEVSQQTCEAVRKATAAFGLSSTRTALNSVVSALLPFRKRFAILSAMFRDDSKPDEIQQWWLEDIEIALRDCEFKTVEDGHMLFQAAIENISLRTQILDTVKKHADSTPFTITFIADLLGTGLDSGGLIGTDTMTAAIYVLPVLMKNFDLASSIPETTKILRYHTSTFFGGNEAEERTRIESETGPQLASLVTRCSLLGMKTEAEQIMVQVISEAWKNPVKVFDAAIFPFLKSVLDEPAAIESNEHLFQALFQQLLAAYVQRYVGKEPTRPTNWAKPPKGCSSGCKDCKELRSFCIDPSRSVWHYKAAEHRRNHLWNQIEGSYSSRNTECDYTQTTLRQGSPYILVLTKNHTSFEVATKAWKDRCTVAWVQLNLLGPALTTLLGDKYASIMSLAFTEPSPLGLLTDTSHNIVTPQSGLLKGQSRKRKMTENGRASVPGYLDSMPSAGEPQIIQERSRNGDKRVRLSQSNANLGSNTIPGGFDWQKEVIVIDDSS